MNTKDTKPVWEELFERFGSPPISNDELAQRIANLERRSAVHDQAIKILMTILDQVREAGFSLVLTDEQTAEMHRWLNESQEKTEGALPPTRAN